MGGFILRRATQLVPVLLGVTLATFLLVQIIPGDPTDVLLGPGASEEARQALRASMGLDRSLLVQYLTYLGHLLRFDLGQSLVFGEPVAEVLAERLGNTTLLAMAAIVLASIAGVGAGAWAAIRPGSWRDRVLGGSILILNSMPSFWLGLILILLGSLRLRLLPSSGMYDEVYGGGVLDLAAHMVLPTLTLAAWSVAVIARITRSALLDVINQDYVRTARSRGLGEWRVVLGHALPNAMASIVTVVGLQLGFLLSGAVLAETVFSWPGIGLAMYQAIGSRDMPLIQGGVLMLAVLFVLINFAVDVLYVYFNPKLKLR
jgi:peptide/nickel transport system permease protein